MVRNVIRVASPIGAIAGGAEGGGMGAGAIDIRGIGAGGIGDMGAGDVRGIGPGGVGAMGAGNVYFGGTAPAGPGAVSASVMMPPPPTRSPSRGRQRTFGNTSGNPVPLQYRNDAGPDCFLAVYPARFLLPRYTP
jgi:hypothetical protein